MEVELNAMCVCVFHNGKQNKIELLKYYDYTHCALKKKVNIVLSNCTLTYVYLIVHCILCKIGIKVMLLILFFIILIELKKFSINVSKYKQVLAHIHVF